VLRLPALHVVEACAAPAQGSTATAPLSGAAARTAVPARHDKRRADGRASGLYSL